MLSFAFNFYYLGGEVSILVDDTRNNNYLTLIFSLNYFNPQILKHSPFSMTWEIIDRRLIVSQNNYNGNKTDYRNRSKNGEFQLFFRNVTTHEALFRWNKWLVASLGRVLSQIKVCLRITAHHCRAGIMMVIKTRAINGWKGVNHAKDTSQILLRTSQTRQLSSKY